MQLCSPGLGPQILAFAGQGGLIFPFSVAPGYIRVPGKLGTTLTLPQGDSALQLPPLQNWVKIQDTKEKAMY